MVLKEKLLILATIGIFIGNGLLYFCLCHLREINERDKRIEMAVLEDRQSGNGTSKEPEKE